MTERKHSHGVRKVLLAESDPRAMELLAAHLRQAGYQVVTLTQWGVAAPLFKTFWPDAVVLGVGDDPVPALLTGRKLWQLAKGGLPLLYLTGSDDPGLTRRCLVRGMGTEVCPRSVTPGELCARLAAQLRLKERVLEGSKESSRSILLDPLTGTYTRAFLLAMLREELRRAERYGEGFSVAVGQVANLTQVEQRFGREVADRLLVYSGLVLSQAVREVDVVARIDAATFAVLMPRTPGEKVASVVARVSERLQGSKFRLDGRWVQALVSLGYASFPEVLGTPARLLDEALMHARRLQSSQAGGRTEWARI